MTLSLTLLAPQCEWTDNSKADSEMKAATEQAMQEANARVGMPGIKNFTERRFAKLLFELRDQEMATYTYIVDMNGRYHFICNSIGYGIPYSVQYTNPMRSERGYQTSIALPQADPNGLFMPQGLSATFVMCAVDGEYRPVYVEPPILVSPFLMTQKQDG